MGSTQSRVLTPSMSSGRRAWTEEERMETIVSRCAGLDVHKETVAACVRSTVGRWVFPITPDDDVPIEFPVLFTPAQ